MINTILNVALTVTLSALVLVLASILVESVRDWFAHRSAEDYANGYADACRYRDEVEAWANVQPEIDRRAALMADDPWAGI